MDMEEWQGKEDISGCWMEEKGRTILQSNPTQHAVKKRGEREILERRSANLACYKAEYARFSYCFPVKYSTRSHCAQMKISPGQKVTPNVEKRLFGCGRLRPFCCSNDRQKKNEYDASRWSHPEVKEREREKIEMPFPPLSRAHNNLCLVAAFFFSQIVAAVVPPHIAGERWISWRSPKDKASI